MKEQQLQTLIADYIRLRHPSAIFHSDFGSGAKLTIAQAARQKRQNGGRRAWPDIFIAEPRGKYHGLFIELKREGTTIIKKDGTLVANAHIREQFDLLHDLRRRGYKAEFGIGFENTIAIIDEYFKGADPWQDDNDPF